MRSTATPTIVLAFFGVVALANMREIEPAVAHAQAAQPARPRARRTARAPQPVSVAGVAGSLRRDHVLSHATERWSTIAACLRPDAVRARTVVARIAVGSAGTVQLLSLRAPPGSEACVRAEILRWVVPGAGQGRATVTFRKPPDSDTLDITRVAGGVIDGGSGLIGGPAAMDTGGDTPPR